MKRLFILFLLLGSGLASHSVYACDVCGCKLGGLYFGILPQFENHFVGLRYSNAAFRAAVNYNSDYLEDETSNDLYQRIDLIGRYSLSEKWKVNVIVPYLMNEMDGSHQRIVSNGIGDPMIIAYYQLVNNGADIARKNKHALLIGGGLKLPLGEFTAEDQGEIINRNFQLGSGSLDYLLSANYTVRRKAAGINAEASYKLNTANSDNYRFGNQFNMSTYAFYWMEWSGVSLLPYAGSYFEYGDNHTNFDFREVNTGGHATFASMGMQVYAGNLTVNMQYQVPVAQRFNTDGISEIEAGNRMSLSLLWNISKKKDMPGEGMMGN
ncbi:MAG: hypothetical protein WBA74_05785 [Cyclobacteriaceae bacterium]